MKKQLPLILSAIFIVSLLLLFDFQITMPSMATDSGWDTSYDSGWSGDSSWDTGSSWDYDSGSSYHSSSSTSSTTSEGGDLAAFIILIVFTVGFLIWFIGEIRMHRRIRKVKIYYERRTEGINPEIVSSMFNAPESEEDKELLKIAYQIYLDVQKAWMNFDYATLKKLLTNELYHTYQNQLDVLKLKEQKNIMSDFTFHSSKIINKIVNDSIHTVIVELVVSFYDYVVDKDEKVIRGSKNRKVEITYHLTFLYDEEATSTCPHCGAEMENRETTCPYCNTIIQAVTKDMRLAKKECINQK